jgi:hypothetical protein
MGGSGVLSQSSGQFAPAAAMVREQELCGWNGTTCTGTGTISHALLLTTVCVQAIGSGYVFPGIALSLGTCGSPNYGGNNSGRPNADQLFFCDYTPTQISGFSISAWQKTILTAFCTYGGYIDITQTTNSAPAGIVLQSDEEMESSEAWKYANPGADCTLNVDCYNDPFYLWVKGQGGLGGSSGAGCADHGSSTSTWRCIGAFLTNIPPTVTTGSMSVDSLGNACGSGTGCLPSGHIHVADQCIPKRYANVAGQS